MIRLILAEGCSAISGVEQLDYKDWNNDPRNKSLEYSEHTWPALLWKEKYPTALYYPTARNGSSNMSIRRRIIHYTRNFLNNGYKPDEILVCIQWSGIDRMEFSRSQTHYIKNESEFNFENINPVFIQSGSTQAGWLKIQKFDNIIGSLYKNHYLDDDMLYYSYSNIDAANTFLTSTGVSCIQSAGFENLFMHLEKPNSFTQNLIDINQPALHYELHPKDKNKKLGFFQYCQLVLGKADIGPRGHPLKKGHRIWYEKIKQRYQL